MALTPRQAERKQWLEQAIKEIQYAQLNGIKSEALTMSFNGRSMQRFTPEELEKMRLRYDQELTKLERMEAGNYSRTIRVYG